MTLDNLPQDVPDIFIDYLKRIRRPRLGAAERRTNSVRRYRARAGQPEPWCSPRAQRFLV